MTKDRRHLVPVIVGVVGGDAELKSLEPVFDQFRKTFGDSTPVMVLQVEKMREAKLFR